MISVSGEGSGVAGTSYTLKCRVTVPFGVSQFSPNMQWKRPDMPFTPAKITAYTTKSFTATLFLSSLQTSLAGEYICQAGYLLGNLTSELANGTFNLDIIGKPANPSWGMNSLFSNSFRPNRPSHY